MCPDLLIEFYSLKSTEESFWDKKAKSVSVTKDLSHVGPLGLSQGLAY